MKKFLLTLTLFINYLFADSLFNQSCIKDNFYLDTNEQIIFQYSSHNTVYTRSFSDSQLQLILDSYKKFEFDEVERICKLKTNDDFLGMNESDFAFMMALTGLLTGVLIVFSILIRI